MAGVDDAGWGDEADIGVLSIRREREVAFERPGSSAAVSTDWPAEGGSGTGNGGNRQRRRLRCMRLPVR
jgi:hypothetical protein